MTADAPLILASQSASRKAMLEAAGVAFDAHAADVDEAELKCELIAVPPGEIAAILAEAKAMAVSVGRASTSVSPGKMGALRFFTRIDWVRRRTTKLPFSSV